MEEGKGMVVNIAFLSARLGDFIWVLIGFIKVMSISLSIHSQCVSGARHSLRSPKGVRYLFCPSAWVPALFANYYLTLQPPCSVSSIFP